MKYCIINSLLPVTAHFSAVICSMVPGTSGCHQFEFVHRNSWWAGVWTGVWHYCCFLILSIIIVQSTGGPRGSEPWVTHETPPKASSPIVGFFFFQKAIFVCRLSWLASMKYFKVIIGLLLAKDIHMRTGTTPIYQILMVISHTEQTYLFERCFVNIFSVTMKRVSHFDMSLRMGFCSFLQLEQFVWIGPEFHRGY